MCVGTYVGVGVGVGTYIGGDVGVGTVGAVVFVFVFVLVVIYQNTGLLPIETQNKYHASVAKSIPYRFLSKINATYYTTTTTSTTGARTLSTCLTTHERTKLFEESSSEFVKYVFLLSLSRTHTRSLLTVSLLSFNKNSYRNAVMLTIYS